MAASDELGDNFTLGAGQRNQVTLYTRTAATPYQVYVNGQEVIEIGEALTSSVEEYPLSQYHRYRQGWRHRLWANSRVNFEGCFSSV